MHNLARFEFWVVRRECSRLKNATKSLFFFCGVQGSNFKHCLYYELSLPTELNRRQTTLTREEQ